MFTNILLPDLSGEVSRQILSLPTDSSQKRSCSQLLWELRLPLKYLSPEVVFFWPTIKWNSQAGQLTIFGTQKSVLWSNMLHLALLRPNYFHIVIFIQRMDAQMHRPTSWEHKNYFLKVSTHGTSIFHLGPYINVFCKDESRILYFQQTEVNTFELFLYLSNTKKKKQKKTLLAQINHYWLNFQVNQTRKECKKGFKRWMKIIFWNWFWKVTVSIFNPQFINYPN